MANVLKYNQDKSGHYEMRMKNISIFQDSENVGDFLLPDNLTPDSGSSLSNLNNHKTEGRIISVILDNDLMESERNVFMEDTVVYTIYTTVYRPHEYWKHQRIDNSFL